MTKLITFIAALFLFASVNAYSQCTPDTTMSGLTQPTEAQGLDTAVANHVYNEVIYIHIPEDTVVPPLTFPIPIDSASLKSVQNLPPSFTYVPDQSDNTWLGGEYGCVQIVGTPTMSDTGFYDITVTIEVYSNNDTVSDDLIFDFAIIDSMITGINQLNGISSINVYPNPAKDETKIRFYSKDSKSIEIRLINLNGQIIRKDIIEAKSGNNKHIINTSDLSSGVYFYSIIDNNQRIYRKIIIE